MLNESSGMIAIVAIDMSWDRGLSTVLGLACWLWFVLRCVIICRLELLLLHPQTLLRGCEMLYLLLENLLLREDMLEVCLGNLRRLCKDSTWRTRSKEARRVELRSTWEWKGRMPYRRQINGCMYPSCCGVETGSREFTSLVPRSTFSACCSLIWLLLSYGMS